jgi:hypothetical protein
MSGTHECVAASVHSVTTRHAQLLPCMHGTASRTPLVLLGVLLLSSLACADGLEVA